LKKKVQRVQGDKEQSYYQGNLSFFY